MSIKDGLYVLALILLWILCHEYGHYIIFAVHECDDIIMEFNTDHVGIGADLNSCIFPKETLLAQNINDIIGYSIMPFLLLLAYQNNYFNKDDE